MPDTDFLENLKDVDTRAAIEAVKRILDDKDAQGTRFRRAAFASQIHRALENSVVTAHDVLAAINAVSRLHEDLQRERSTARQLFRSITDDQNDINRFENALGHDHELISLVDRTLLGESRSDSEKPSMSIARWQDSKAKSARVVVKQVTESAPEAK